MQNMVDIFKNRVILATYPMTFSQVMGTWERSWERTKPYRSHSITLKNNNNFRYGNEGTTSRARMRKTTLYIQSILSIQVKPLYSLAGDNIFRSLVPIYKKINKKQSSIMGTINKTRSHDRSHVPMLLTANQINL